MKQLTLEQKKIISDFLSNLAVVWFGGGVAAPILAGQELSQAIRPAIWGVALAILFLVTALWLNKKEK